MSEENASCGLKDSADGESKLDFHGDTPVVEISNLWTKFGRTVCTRT